MKSNKKWSMLTLIMMFWFTISFITNILGPLIPDIIHNFELKDLAMAGFIPTSFFLAYAIMSIPAGILIDKYGEKPVLFTGFLMPFIGTTLFACFPFYLILLLSSFIIGLGMAMLQTVINPLQRVVGGEENYAFIAELAQFVFGVASFISPLVYTWLIHALEPEVYQQGQNFLLDILAKVTPVTLPWVSLYWVFTALLLAMLLVVSFVHFPRIELKDDERSGSSSSYKKLFRQKYVWLFFLGIFCYVSTELGVSIFMLKLIDSKRLLQISGLLSMSLLLIALFGSAKVAVCAFPVIGFCISMMYSIVFSLALNTVAQNHGSFAGILCSGIVGGAGGPLFVSLLSDTTSLRIGMLLILVFMGYITFIGFWAHPLVNNKTVSLKELVGFKNKNKILK